MTTNEPTYGVIASNGTETRYYLGDDEVLWDWTNAPVAFTEPLAEIPLPDGYVVLDAEDRLIKGKPALGITDILVSEKNTFDDKAYILTCSMPEVNRQQFMRAGLSDERIIRSEIF